MTEAEPTWDSRDAFHELLDLLRDADRAFIAGDRAVHDEVSVAEGYRYLTEALHAALEIYLWSDPERPHFVPIVGPTFKWGGDNSDAFYNYAPVAPGRAYRILGRRGDACYIAVCVYGGPNDGRWSTRIVSNISDRDMTFAPDGTFEIVCSSRRPTGAPNWLALADDAVALITRDYHVDPAHGAPTTYEIAAEPAAALPSPLTDSEAARRFRAVTNFLRELLAITPLPAPPAPNTIAEVWAVPDVTYGWAAKDAHYAMGSFDLGTDEALVVEGRSPAGAYWGCMLWNPFMQTFDYRYERIGINGEQTAYEPDGSWRLVVAHRDPGTPNWLSTAGHPRGVLFFRWFLAEETPPTPTARVMPLAELR